MFETINAPFWGCSDIHFLKKGRSGPPKYEAEILKDGCFRETFHDVSLAVDYVDFRKDGISPQDPRYVSHDVQQITCPDRTMLISSSVINGLLMCIERGYHANNDGDGDGNKGEYNGRVDVQTVDKSEQTEIVSFSGDTSPSVPSSAAATDSTIAPKSESSSTLHSLFTVTDLHELLASESTTMFGLMPNMDDLDWRHNNLVIDVKQSSSWSNRKSDFFNTSSGD
jgi:hypothetical protein